MTEQAARDDAFANYNTAKAGFGNQLYQAALRYGDPTTMAQYSEYGPPVENPNSRLATAQRAEDQGIEQSGLAQNANNTFFSGLHLRADQLIHDQAARDRLAAQQEYENAKAELDNLIAQAGNTYSSAIRDTGASAIDRVLSQEPIPGPAPPPHVTKPGPAQYPGPTSNNPNSFSGAPPGYVWDPVHFKYVRKK